MKLAIAKLGILMAFSPLGISTDAVGKSVPSDTEVMGILTRNCAGCHQAADHPGALFLNQERLTEKETLTLIEKLIKTSQMPPAHKKFGSTPDGKNLMKWIAEQKKKK